MNDSDVEIASLRRAGADHLDPVRFRFFEAMAKRARQQPSDVQRILDGKLMAALAAYGERLQQTHRDAVETVTRLKEQYPDSAEDLQRLFRAGELRELRRFVSTLDRKAHRVSLADLVRDLSQPSQDEPDGRLADGIGDHPDLKTIRYFRDTWSRLSAQRQVTEAIRQAPQNAGPLNSSGLVVRSLALMRDISPDYLNRFVTYMDTLQWLDQTEEKKRLVARKRPATRRPDPQRLSG